jgi:hypothetical protein
MKKYYVFILVFLLLSVSGIVNATYTSEPTSSDVDSITLESNGEKIEWSVDGYSGKGFKVSWSKNPHPTYPLRSGDKYHYFSDPYKSNDVLTAFDGNGIYYVRVCEYLGGSCGVYSNEVTVSIGGEDEKKDVESIVLTGSGEKIFWKTDGHSAKGFKVVWSKNQYPMYPTRTNDKYHYFSSSLKDFDTLTPFSGNGEYYVRVCEYLGGRCGLYSNEIKLTLSEVDSTDIDNYTGNAKSITLSGEGNKVKWSVDGYSDKGYKVVWSKSENPVYPNRPGVDKYHYYPASSNIFSDKVTAFSGDGLYYVRVCEYLGAKCGTYSNQIKVSLVNDVVCTMDYAPVCGTNGRTYSNECEATQKYGVKIAYKSKCEKDDDIKLIEKKAELLIENKLDAILAEMNELRSIVKEQNTQIKYLKSLLSDLSNVTAAMQNSINSFITYGVDENTKRLGEGERAAVMHSYKAAFGKLPETEEDLADAVKIANGRWPTMGNEEAEAKAYAKFEEIYKRPVDVSSEKDMAAVKVMAYGLRQRAENRNLNSERNGIQIFKAIFGRTPGTTEEWNTMQAITYSGATR